MRGDAKGFCPLLERAIQVDLELLEMFGIVSDLDLSFAQGGRDLVGSVKESDDGGFVRGAQLPPQKSHTDLLYPGGRRG